MTKAKTLTEIEVMLLKEVERNRASLLRGYNVFTLEAVLAQTNSLVNVFYGAKGVSDTTVQALVKINYAAMYLINESNRVCRPALFEEYTEAEIEKSRTWLNEQEGGNWDDLLARLIN